jgi:4-diphosphocytidyl-2-C-methyl-D-erythritol kinase
MSVKYATRTVTVRAPAKVNLQLRVGPVRDGYHELVSVFHAVSLFDEVTVTPSDELRVEVTGDPSLALESVPLGMGNLAAKAVRELATVLGTEPRLHLHIDKYIPVAGGMAGGSADAAAVLLACNRLWGDPLDRDELLRIAARLGSDVPFSLVGGTALGEGRGEVITPVETRGRFHWAFGCSPEGLSTPAVYGQFDRHVAKGRRRIDWPAPSAAELLRALAEGDAEALGAALCNDLQEPAVSLRPELERILATGLGHGALGAILSGSGPTCAFLARNAGHAVAIAEGLLASGATASAACAHGPVPGARVVARRAQAAHL